jgi:hypothetical protein
MKTHELAAGVGGASYQLAGVNPDQKWNPFWVVQATPAIIDGHNNIFGASFLQFVADLVFRHVGFSRSATPPRSMS